MRRNRTRDLSRISWQDVRRRRSAIKNLVDGSRPGLPSSPLLFGSCSMDLKGEGHMCGNPVKEMTAENGEGDGVFQNGRSAENLNSSPFNRSSVSPGMTDEWTDERVMSIFSNILPSSGFPHIKPVDSFSYEKRSDEVPKNQKSKRKAGKTREKTTRIVAESVEGFMGDQPLTDILDFLGEDEASNSKNKKKSKKSKKGANVAQKQKEVQQNGSSVKGATEKPAKKNGGAKPQKKGKQSMSTEASSPQWSPIPARDQPQSPPSEVDQEVDITLDTAEEEEFVSAPEDNNEEENSSNSFEKAKLVPVDSPERVAGIGMVLKLPDGREVKIPAGLPQNRRPPTERELAVGRMWNSFMSDPPPKYITE
ncbi:hypothetical protein QR680_012992 [Steinernema hermaphroditum]|uniref:Uncharacterized protein n=1 Tax=Steinernema hermaphroditum TaxID=289476 RepID=A0AA39M1S8_9BILA|nr:hypothetical protein QR680_012992 [Steinernema hermaphroditum]